MVEKAADEFYVHSVSHKLVAHCKPCYRERSRQQHRSQLERDPSVRRRRGLKHRYNLTVEQYDAMLEKQDGKCAVCGRSGTLYVDHDHDTGVVRGLLCPRCNTCMNVLDTEDLLQRLQQYKAASWTSLNT